MRYCTISTVSSVMHHSQKKKPPFKIARTQETIYQPSQTANFQNSWTYGWNGTVQRKLDLETALEMVWCADEVCTQVFQSKQVSMRYLVCSLWRSILSSCPDLEGIMGIGVEKTQTWVKMVGSNDNDVGEVLNFFSILTDRTFTRRWLNPRLYDLKMAENDWILMIMKLYENDKAWL